LSSPDEGLFLDQLVWSDQEYVEPGSVLLVLASEEYDESQYVRDYSEFRSLVNQPAGATATVTVVPEDEAGLMKGTAAPEAGSTRKTKEAQQKRNRDEIAFLDLRHPSKLQSRLVSACERVISSGHYVHGPDVALFEAEWARYCETDHAVGVASGLDALTLMLRGAFLEAGDGSRCGDDGREQTPGESAALCEIIVPANTYIATVLGVTMAGFAPALVEKAITPKTRAILAVDLYGLPADVSALRSIADKHGLRLFWVSQKGNVRQNYFRFASKRISACRGDILVQREERRTQGPHGCRQGASFGLSEKRRDPRSRKVSPGEFARLAVVCLQDMESGTQQTEIETE